MSPNPLLGYELTLFRRSFADAFSRTRDRLLLVVILTFALLWLHSAVAGSGAYRLPRYAELFAAGAGPISFVWNRLVLRRLAWLAEHSALAPAANDRWGKRNYLVAAQLIPLLVGTILIWLLFGGSWKAIVIAAVAHGGGLVAALACKRRRRETSAPGQASLMQPSGPNAAFLSLLRFQMRGGGLRAAGSLVAANALFTFCACRFAANQAPELLLAAAALPSLLLLAITNRNDAQQIGFLAYTGHSAAFVALVVCMIPAVSFAASALSVMAARPIWPLSMLALLFVLHLGAALVAIARAWLSPGRTTRNVDLQVQVEAAALVAAGLVFLPLAVVLLLSRTEMLRRNYRSALWKQL